jgi:5'-nucleotidase (lipoprotein e(P4) family)
MNSAKFVITVASLLILTACASTTTVESDPLPDHAILWAAHAAEYQAISLQVYAQATRDLPRFIADTSWSALPGHEGMSDKPPAVILDVDETVTSGVDMEMTMVPFTALRQYEWGLTHKAIPVRGVAQFVAAAQGLGVEVFFVTNRPCELLDGNPDACPQKQATVDHISEVGIETDIDHVLLAKERPGWDREKLTRREHIAKSHRVIMLLGDDYGDFVACSRASPRIPCTGPATRASRADDLDTYKNYWGNGWYILPNPMYGSWTSVK